MLIVPFVLEIAIAVGLTGYLSFRNGQQAVNQLANRLLDEMGEHISHRLDSYLETAKRENQSNANALRLGVVKPDDLQKLGTFFWNQVQTYHFDYINFENPAGEAIGAGYSRGLWHISGKSRPSLGDTNVYGVDSWGTRDYLFKLARDTALIPDDWYTTAVEARRQVWTPIRIWDAQPTQISMAVSTPIFDRSNRLIGVTSVDLNLQKIHQFLDNLNGGRNATRNATIFIIERSGLLVASSSDRPVYKSVNGNVRRLRPSDNWDSLMSAATEHLTQKFRDLREIRTSQQLSFTRDDERQFIQVTPYSDELGLDWLIVVAVPESDFMGEIHNNNRTTILLCAIALAGAIALGLLTSHWIAKPILRLSKASRDLALGKLDYSVQKTSRIAELEILAHSFDQMTEHLQQSFDEVSVALQESEEKFTKVFRTSPDPIAISTLEGKFLEVNDSFVTVFGYPKAEVIGRTAKEIGLWANLEDREKLIQALQTSETLCNSEYNFYARSGELVTVLFSSDIIELNGQACMLGVAKDITGRKRAEEALRQSEQRFRGAFATSAVGIGITSPEGRFLQANCALCEMLGYIESDLLELTFQDVTHPEDVEIDLEYIRQLMAGEIPYFQIQKRYQHRDGHVVWGLLSVSLVRNRQRQPLYLVAQIQDITDRQRAEAELKAQRAFLRQVMEVVPGSILVKDWEGNFIPINQASAELYGTTLDDSSGKNE